MGSICRRRASLCEFGIAQLSSSHDAAATSEEATGRTIGRVLAIACGLLDRNPIEPVSEKGLVRSALEPARSGIVKPMAEHGLLDWVSGCCGDPADPCWCQPRPEHANAVHDGELVV